MYVKILFLVLDGPTGFFGNLACELSTSYLASIIRDYLLFMAFLAIPGKIANAAALACTASLYPIGVREETFQACPCGSRFARPVGRLAG